MADNDLQHKIPEFINTFNFFVEILVAILPTLIFLVGCSILIGRFIERLIGSPQSTSILEVIITGSILIQVMRLWGLAVASVDLLTEFVCQKLLEECYLLTSPSVFQDACIVFEPWISCFFACTTMSLIPWSILTAWNAFDQYSLQRELLAWIRFSRWNRTEMGMSLYFLENPMSNEQMLSELRNYRQAHRRKRSKEREQRNLTRSTSCQNLSSPIDLELKASRSI